MFSGAKGGDVRERSQARGTRRGRGPTGRAARDGVMAPQTLELRRLDMRHRTRCRVPTRTGGRRMATSVPGYREDDSWFSEEQLAHLRPADEAEPFRSPIPTQMVSNGEYVPHPQTEKQQRVEARIKELAHTVSRDLGITRRQFLAGTGGMAAAFLAMNEVFGAEFFRVRPEELYEPAAF